VFTNIFFIATAITLQHLGPTLVVVILLMLAWSLTGIVYYLRQKSRTSIIQTNTGNEMIKSHKILTLVSDPVEAD
jgi:hypothetical protein